MFYFNGAAPIVKFYAGVNGHFSDSTGFGIRKHIEGRSYSNESFILELPKGKFFDDFDSLSARCVEVRADY
jgi:hypothetical protein